MPDPVLGSARLVGPPIKFAGSPRARAEAAPNLGEHTDDVLRGAGYTADDVTRLRTTGVV